MQLDLGLESDDVVGQHRQLGLEHLAGPRPRPALARRPLRGVACCAATTTPRPTAAAPARSTGSTQLVPLSSPPSPPPEPVAPSPDTAASATRSTKSVSTAAVSSPPASSASVAQLGRLTGGQFAAAGAEAVADDDAIRPVAVDRLGELAGHLGGIATGEVGRRRRQNGDVDGRVGASDRRTQLLDLVRVECPLGVGIDVHRVAAQLAGDLLEVHARRRAGRHGSQRQRRRQQSHADRVASWLHGTPTPRRRTARRPSRCSASMVRAARERMGATVMPERDGYIPGVPCWVDTSQPDPEAALPFYRGLFGWEFEDVMPEGSPGSTSSGASAAATSRRSGRSPRVRRRRRRGTPTSGSTAPTRRRRRPATPAARW